MTNFLSHILCNYGLLNSAAKKTKKKQLCYHGEVIPDVIRVISGCGDIELKRDCVGAQCVTIFTFSQNIWSQSCVSELMYEDGEMPVLVIVSVLVSSFEGAWSLPRVVLVERSGTSVPVSLRAMVSVLSDR